MALSTFIRVQLWVYDLWTWFASKVGMAILYLIGNDVGHNYVRCTVLGHTYIARKTFKCVIGLPYCEKDALKAPPPSDKLIRRSDEDIPQVFNCVIVYASPGSGKTFFHRSLPPVVMNRVYDTDNLTLPPPDGSIVLTNRPSFVRNNLNNCIVAVVPSEQVWVDRVATKLPVQKGWYQDVCEMANKADVVLDTKRYLGDILDVSVGQRGLMLTGRDDVDAFNFSVRAHVGSIDRVSSLKDRLDMFQSQLEDLHDSVRMNTLKIANHLGPSPGELMKRRERVAFERQEDIPERAFEDINHFEENLDGDDFDSALKGDDGEGFW